MSSPASSAISGVVAATAATSSPVNRSRRAPAAFASVVPESSTGLPESSVAPSAAKASGFSNVRIALTPASLAASEASIPAMRACGWGLRNTRP